MTAVLLATCAEWAGGEPAAHELDRVLAARGISAAWADWRDRGVDWGSARVVAVRSTWDYIDHHHEFVDWSREVARHSLLLNGPDVFVWNTDKQYLVELGAAGVPVVPSVSVDAREDLVAAVASFEGRVVVKPRIGVGGHGLVVVDDPDAVGGLELGSGPWLAQPVVESIATEGERSVFVIGGNPTYAVKKLPASGNILVHEHHGGRTVPEALEEEAVSVAKACVSTTEGLLNRTLHYARVDLLRLDGELVVSELEATEPGLYLDVVPENAVPFADLLGALLAEGATAPGRHR